MFIGFRAAFAAAVIGGFIMPTAAAEPAKPKARTVKCVSRKFDPAGNVVLEKALDVVAEKPGLQRFDSGSGKVIKPAFTTIKLEIADRKTGKPLYAVEGLPAWQPPRGGAGWFYDPRDTLAEKPRKGDRITAADGTVYTLSMDAEKQIHGGMMYCRYVKGTEKKPDPKNPGEP